MTWQGFQYAFLHAYRDAGASAISGFSAFATDGPKDFLIDDRAGSLCTFAAASASHRFQCDRGAAGLEELTRLIIPEGHNLNGKYVRVRTDSAADMSVDPTEILAATLVSSTGIIDLAMTGGNATQRKYQYVRLDFSGSGSFTPELPELIMTRTRTTTRGPEQGWGDMLHHNTLDFMKESGAIASLSLGADRRAFDLVYRDVSLAADLSVFSELLSTCGTSKPFHVDEPFTGSDAIWMKLTEDSQQKLDRASPGSPDSARPEIRLSMLEHLA